MDDGHVIVAVERICGEERWIAAAVRRLVHHNQARLAAATSADTATGRLRHFAADPDSNVRCRVARNPRTPPEALAELAGDVDDLVRHYTADNRATPPDALSLLASDDVADVRCGVAGNPSAPADVLERLAGDTDCVRIGVAGNPSAPADVLTSLESDDYVLVYDALRANPATADGLAERCANSDNPAVRANVAARAGSEHQELLRQLASDPSPEVRSRVASSEHCPADVFTKLASDSDPDVRWGVAIRSNCPLRLRASLAVDRDREVRGAAIVQLVEDAAAVIGARGRSLIAAITPQRRKAAT